MINTLMLFIVYICYKCELSEPEVHNDGKVIYRFKLIPRKIVVFFILLIPSIVMILYYGLKETLKCFEDSCEIQSLNYFKVKQNKGDKKPTKWQCLKQIK